ncbi:hypothetical protein [Geoalkalibacter subterraneus]|uniref:Uncharacterized protein n=1 Tax=Geoalkalibacter subterraneus TaxID=483547 RepID=A0A0B5FHX9_9BACT|nr:hypothetical protein [Geoalkalibacter subterraneus]AJF07802.1 hypothetical protein GSUB_16305 [Geoalkalibacter subterraneus]
MDIFYGTLTAERIKDARRQKCTTCIHRQDGDVCLEYPDGIPRKRLDRKTKCRTWKDRWSADDIEAMLPTKKGAMIRIAEAAKNGESPNSDDFALLNNKQGRPKVERNPLADHMIIEDFWELREQGYQYIEACYGIQEKYFKRDDGSYSRSIKHIKAMVTKDQNDQKKRFFEWHKKHQSDANKSAQEVWDSVTKEKNEYLRECKR